MLCKQCLTTVYKEYSHTINKTLYSFHYNVWHVKWPSVGHFNNNSALAPSVFGAMWFCRWVVTHSLNGFRLPWPPSCGLYHIEHPFAFIGRLEQTLFSPAYLESVRLNPSLPVLLTRNGPLRIIDAWVYLPSNGVTKGRNSRTDLKFERRPRSHKERPTDTSSHCFTPRCHSLWFELY